MLKREIPGFIEFKIAQETEPLSELERRAQSSDKLTDEKKRDVVSWKLKELNPTDLPYSNAPFLQANYLKEKKQERLSSVNIFLRADHVPPETIILKRKGFHPHPTITGNYGKLWDKPDKILDIERHRITSAYTGSVSCTDNIQVLKNFNADQDNIYVYMLKASGAVTTGDSRMKEECEYTVPGGVDADDIIAFRKLSSDFGFSASDSLYVSENFLKDNSDLLEKILSVYLEKGEVAIIPQKIKTLDEEAPEITLEQKKIRPS